MINRMGIVPLTGLLIVMVLLFVSLPTVVAQSPPPPRPDPPPDRPGAPPPRPDPPQLPPQIPAGGGGNPGYVGSEGDSTTILPCSTIYGFVQNWGYQNEPNVVVNMGGASWQVQELTDDNGYYASDCLGMGIGVINPVTPPGLNPLTEDVAVRLGSRESFEVNLGLYGSESPSGWPVKLTMTASDAAVMPGQTLTYTIQVTNTLDEATSGRIMESVLLTDLFQEGLIPVEATTTQGTIELWDNLISVEFGQLLPGQTAVVTIAAMAQYDALPSVITNKASLIYKDHVTIQTSPVLVDIQSTKGMGLAIPLLLPETGAAYPSSP